MSSPSLIRMRALFALAALSSVMSIPVAKAQEAWSEPAYQQNPNRQPEPSNGQPYQQSPYSAPQPYHDPRAYANGANAYGQPPQSYGAAPAGDAYSPGAHQPPEAYANGGDDAYSPNRGGGQPAPRADSFSDPGEPVGGSEGPGYGAPYAPPPAAAGQSGGYASEAPASNTYNQNEIIGAGHNFFGTVNKNLASAIEYAFQSQGRPNGYILGEDAGGALVLGLRYGEGKLFTKDAGDHKVFWQGPSVGYDAGAEGSKAMVLVYNLRDPSEIYNRFGGVQGAAYLVGGFSVQFQKYNDVTLGIIRSGVGVRLGANIGYLKYTREPTWNPL